MNRENMIEIDPLQEKIGEVIFSIKNKLGEEKIKVETINIVLKDVMELVENFKIPGDEKKKIVIKIVKELVDDLVYDELEKKLIYEIIDKNLLEKTIDLIILASRGEFNLNNRVVKNKFIDCTKTLCIVGLEYFINFLKLFNPSSLKKNKKKSNKNLHTATPMPSPIKV